MEILHATMEILHATMEIREGISALSYPQHYTLRHYYDPDHLPNSE